MEKSEEDIVQSYMEEAKSILRQQKPENMLKNALGLYKEEFLKNGIAEEVDGNMEFIEGTPFKASLDSLVEKISEVFPEKSKESELFKRVEKLWKTLEIKSTKGEKGTIQFITFFMDNDGLFQLTSSIARGSTAYVFEDFIANDEKYKFYYDREKDKVVYWNPELESVLVSMFGEENVEGFSMALVDKRHYSVQYWREGKELRTKKPTFSPVEVGIKDIAIYAGKEHYSIHTSELFDLLNESRKFETIHEFHGNVLNGFGELFFKKPGTTLFLSKVTTKETASQA